MRPRKRVPLLSFFLFSFLFSLSFLSFIFLPSKRRKIEVRKGKEKEERETTREEKFCDDHSFGDRDGTRLRPVESMPLLCFNIF